MLGHCQGPEGIQDPSLWWSMSTAGTGSSFPRLRQGMLVAHQQPAAGARERLFSSPGGSRRSAAGSLSLLFSQIFGTDSAWQLRQFDSAAKHRQRHGPSFGTITRSSGKRGDEGRVRRRGSRFTPYLSLRERHRGFVGAGAGCVYKFCPQHVRGSLSFLAVALHSPEECVFGASCGLVTNTTSLAA